MHIRFDGQVAAVTGAGHGFGLAIAEGLAGLGARVFGTVMPGTSAPVTGAQIDLRPVDLSVREAAAAWIGAVEAEAGQPVDILVNNAGGVAGQVGRPLEEVSDADWDAVFAVNVHAVFAVCRDPPPPPWSVHATRCALRSTSAGVL